MSEGYAPQVVTTNPIFGVSNLSWAVRPKSLIEGFLPQKGVVVIAAAPHTGKTFLGLEMARSIVYASRKERAFLNKFPVTPRLGRVLFVEQDSADWDFRAQYEKIMGYKIEFDPDDFSAENFEESDQVALSIKQIPWLNTDETVHDLAYWANTNSRFLGYESATTHEGEVMNDPVYQYGFDAIILDSLAAMHNYEENQNREMHAVINRMRLLSELTGSCVIVLHHVNKGDSETRNVLSLDRLRGASSIAAAADVVLGLSKRSRFAEEIQLMVLKNRAFPEQRDVDYYMNVDPDREVVELTTTSNQIGSTAYRRNVVKQYLSDRPGQWIDTSDLLIALVDAEKKSREDAQRTYQNTMYKILGEFEREKLIERARGKVRWISVPTDFPQGEVDG